MYAKTTSIVGTSARALALGWGLFALLALQNAQAQGPTQAPAPVCQKLVATGNPEYSPYLWRDALDDSKLVGANADLMQLLSKEIGIPIEVKYVGPWSRVQELARTGKVDLIAGAFFTTARLDYMDYFYPAFRGTRTVIWTNPANSFNYRTWSDLRERKGLTVVNNSFGEEFDAYARKSLSIATVSTLEQALQMLVLARGDYLIYEEDPGLALAAKLNITKLKTAPVAVSTEGLFLTLAHKSECNTGELRGRIAKAMHKLTKDKVMNPLVDANIALWRKQNGG
jgi:polar amino acid transport system substrate-binding protein